MRRARIPADIEREDRLLAGLSARQIAILGATALVLWAIYVSTRHHLPPIVFGALAAPIAGLAAALALGRAEGLSLDRLMRAALRQARSPRRLVQAPEGLPAARSSSLRAAAQVAPLPALVRSLSPEGVVDLGPAGLRQLCQANAVSFSLRSDQEQEALLAAFGRFLNGASAPVEIVVGARPAALGPLATVIEESAPSLPDPGLEEAAREHAGFLRELDETGSFYTSDVLLVVTASPGGAARDQLSHQFDEARSALAGAGVKIAPLSADDASRAIAAAADPLAPTSPAGTSRSGVVRRKR
jgi:hypothetical protein